MANLGKRRPRKEKAMPTQALFGISVAFGFVAWGIVATQYFWPALRVQERADALRPLLILHSFRFVGLSFLIQGVVATELPSAFAVPAAYGDLFAAVLALLALAALRSSFGIPLVWAFNLWGSADLLHALYQGNASGMSAGQLGAAYFIPVFIVPLLLITHGLMFLILLRRDTVPAR
jgi:hypothetical protein